MLLQKLQFNTFKYYRILPQQNPPVKAVGLTKIFLVYKYKSRKDKIFAYEINVHTHDTF